jgi:hypothetical protein
MNKRNKIKAEADEVRSLTMEEAAAQPGMWGKILPCMFREVGYETATINGKKVFFELKEATV